MGALHDIVGRISFSRASHDKRLDPSDVPFHDRGPRIPVSGHAAYEARVEKPLNYAKIPHVTAATEACLTSAWNSYSERGFQTDSSRFERFVMRCILGEVFPNEGSDWMGFNSASGREQRAHILVTQSPLDSFQNDS